MQADNEDRLVEQLATEFAGQPLLELGVWLLLAQQREAATLRAYGPALSACCGPVSEPDVSTTAYTVVTQALSLILHHEAVHTALLDRWKAALQQGSRAAAFHGRLEGWVMLRSMSGKVAPALTRWLKHMMVGKNPTSDAAVDTARPLLASLAAAWAEQEASAADGYARMLTLLNASTLDAIEAQFGPQFAALVPDMLAWELPRLLAEERCHAAVLARVQDWCLPNRNASVPGLEASDVLCELYALGEGHLAIERVENLAAHVLEAVKAHTNVSEIWIGDAGIGDLFSRHAAQPQLLEAVLGPRSAKDE